MKCGLVIFQRDAKSNAGECAADSISGNMGDYDTFESLLNTLNV
jgi:hypothetical protein